MVYGITQETTDHLVKWITGKGGLVKGEGHYRATVLYSFNKKKDYI